MPTYQYEALNSAGKPQKGAVEAVSSEEAIQKIKSQGYFPTAVREQKVKTSVDGKAATKLKKKKKKTDLSAISIGGVGQKKLTNFTRQLSTLQDAGLPIVRSLKILEGQTKVGPFKTTLAHLCEDVESGNSLSEAMSKHPGVFDSLYTNMVKAGEAGGILDTILQRLAEFKEKGII